ncbi:MAG: hypothetical protein AAB339_07350 [Elusimicrobiota bacterium]
MSAFSEELRRSRARVGHSSALNFFNTSGGRGVIRCTYKQYLNIEAGRSLPRPKVLGALAAQLRLWKDPEASRRFFRAFLESLLGKGEILELCLTSLAAPQAASSPSTPLRKALAKSIQARLSPLTPEQSKLIRKDAAHYWTYHVLAGDSGSWKTEDIAGLLAMSLAAVRDAAQALTRSGLAVRDRDGRYWSPYRERHIVHERPMTPERLSVPPYMPQVERLWGSVAKTRGQKLLHHYLFLRASESELRQYFSYLAQVVSGAEVYDTTEKGPDTSFLSVEAVVCRLMPF